MKTAILVLSYNHPDLTAACMDAVQAKSADNLFLMHNGSTTSNQNLLKARFPNWQHLSLTANRGFSGGANYALQELYHRGFEWVIFLTNDCVYLEHPTLPARPALVAPEILLRKTERVDSIGGYFNLLQGRLYHCRSSTEFYSKKWWHLKYVPGTAFALHCDVFRRTGGFDESYGTYWEDVDFGLRVQAKGLEIIADPSWKIRHKVGKTCHSDSHYSLYLFQRNALRFVSQNVPVIFRPLIYAQLSWTWLRLGLKLLRSGRAAEIGLLVKAFRDA